MRIFRLRNLIGLAAIGGAYNYARNHGGFKAAFNELWSKADGLLASRSADTASNRDKT